MKSLLLLTLICSLSFPTQAADANLASELEVTNPLELIQSHASKPERLYLVLQLTCSLWTQLLSGPRFTLDIPDEMLSEDSTQVVELEVSPEVADIVIQFRAFNAVCNLWESIPRLAPLKATILQQFEIHFNQPPISAQLAKFQFYMHTGNVFFKPIQIITQPRQAELNLALQEIEQHLYAYIPSSTTF